MRVSLFVPCLVQTVLPHVGRATARVLSRAGATLDCPQGQTCCGQMVYKTGHHRQAAAMARHFVDLFAASEHVVAPSGSCVAMVRHYPTLFDDDPAYRARAAEVAGKTFELSDFLVNVMGLDDVGARLDQVAAYHDSCQVGRALGLTREPRLLLESVAGLTLREPEGADICCGFGGTFSVQFSEVSEAMLDDKLDALADTGADCVVSAEVSCLLNIKGGLEHRNSPMKALHLAEVLDSGHGDAS